MKTYRMNFDYEAALYDQNYSQNKSKYERMCREMEYIYFFMQKDPSCLKNHGNYEEDYLNYLRSLNCMIPNFTKSDSFENFWGSLRDIELERKLNSKIISLEIAKENHWAPKELSLVKNRGELEALIKDAKREAFLRSPYDMSGRKSFKLGLDQKDLNQVEKTLLEGPMIFDLYRDRIIDLGATFIINEGKINDSFWVQNLNDKKGAFKGGRFGKNLKSILENQYDLDFKSYEEISKKISETYVNKGAKDRIQVDSFFYSESGEKVLYPLVEVNYRKSMGSFLKSMERFLDHEGVGRWILIPSKKIKKFSSFKELLNDLRPYLYSKDLGEGIIPTSPLGLYFSSFFIASESLKEEREFLEKLWEFIGLEKELPDEFLIGF